VAAQYFDTTAGSDDMKRLPQALQDASDIAIWAEDAEALVIKQYTKRAPGQLLDEPIPNAINRVATRIGSSNYYVFLRGYEELAADVDTTSFPYFKADMARTIALAIRWYAPQLKRELGVQSATDGGERGKSRTLTPDAESALPRRWDRWLLEYDTREPLWGF